MGKRVAGVDGCRAGWLVVLVDEQGQPVSSSPARLCRQFEEILLLSPKPPVIAVDIPIGLLDRPQRGGRVCDHQARRLPGPRASSVFSPPSSIVLEAREYADARRYGLSIQAFGSLPKIREVDRLMTPELQNVVHEAIRSWRSELSRAVRCDSTKNRHKAGENDCSR